MKTHTQKHGTRNSVKHWGTKIKQSKREKKKKNEKPESQFHTICIALGMRNEYGAKHYYYLRLMYAKDIYTERHTERTHPHNAQYTAKKQP